MRTTSFGWHRRRPKCTAAGSDFFWLKEDLIISSFPVNPQQELASANATQRKALSALVRLLAREVAHEVGQAGAGREIGSIQDETVDIDRSKT